MKTTPMLLTQAMALAWADGRKTRTQRLIKPQPDVNKRRHRCMMELGNDGILRYGRAPWKKSDPYNFFVEHEIKCPYGAPGDRMHLLTTWATLRNYDEMKPLELGFGAPIWNYFDSPEKPDWCGKLRPGRFMPKWMRELMPTPKILSIGARRIQEITDDEAMEEGIEYVPREIGFSCYRWSLNHHYEPSAKSAFRELWDSINGKNHPWSANPWVWDIKFEGLK